MSKISKVIGVASGVLGASTAVAAGVYVADNPDIVKDYIKGNDTYTSQEMTDVKNDYQGIIDNVNKENKVIKAENEEFSLNITILQNDNAENLKEIERLKAVIVENNSKIAVLESDKEANAGEIASLKAQNSSFATQVQNLNSEVEANNAKILDLTQLVAMLRMGANNLFNYVEGLDSSFAGTKLASGNYILKSITLDVCFYFNVNAGSLVKLENIEGYRVSYTNLIANLGSKSLFYSLSSGEKGLFCFDEESMTFELLDDNFYKRYNTAFNVLDKKITIYGDNDVNNLLVIDNDFYVLELPSTFAPGYSFNAYDCTLNVYGNWLEFSSTSSSPKIYFNIDTKEYKYVDYTTSIRDDYMITKTDNIIQVSNLETNEILHTFDSGVTSVLTDKGFVVGISSVVVDESTEYFLNIFNTLTSSFVSIDMPNSFALSQLKIVDNYLLINVNPVISGDEIGGIYAVDLIKGTKTRVSSKLSVPSVMYSNNGVNIICIDDVVYKFDKTNISLSELCVLSYASAPSLLDESSDKLLFGSSRVGSAYDYVVYDFNSDSAEFLFPGIVKSTLYLSDDYSIVGYSAEDESYYRYALVSHKTLNYIDLAIDLPYSYAMAYKSFANDQHIIVSLLGTASNGDVEFKVFIIDKQTQDFCIVENFNLLSYVSSDKGVLLKDSSNAFVYVDLETKEQSVVSFDNGVACIGTAIVINDGNYFAIYNEGFMSLKCDTSLKLFSLFKDTEDKLIVYSNNKVLVLDKLTGNIVDTFSYTKYFADSNMFKLDIINSGGFYLGSSYVWNEAISSFDKYLIN